MTTNLAQARSLQAIANLDVDRNRPSEPVRPRGPGRGSNLSEQDRIRGGERSARIQVRDAHGHFAGLSRTADGSPKDRSSGNEDGSGPERQKASRPSQDEQDECGEETCAACSIVEQSASSASSR